MILPRTPVSMSLLDMALDEKFFPEPRAYIPERWLDSPKAPTGKPLEHYLNPFGGGTRICLGIK
jgi:cytochrome P450